MIRLTYKAHREFGFGRLLSAFYAAQDWFYGCA